MIRLQLLGPIVIGHGLRAISVDGRIRRGVLVLLALARGSVVPLEHLVAALWEEPPASVNANLRAQLTALRRDFDRAEIGMSTFLSTVRAVRGRGGGYRLDPARARIDAFELGQLGRAVHWNLRTGALGAVLAQGNSALRLYRGRFGDDLPATPWFKARADAFERTRHEIEDDVMLARYLSGEYETLVQDAHVAVTDQPFRERRWVVLAAAHSRSRDLAAALEVVRSCAALFRTELGIDPPPEIYEVQDCLLHRDEARIARIVESFAAA